MTFTTILFRRAEVELNLSIKADINKENSICHIANKTLICSEPAFFTN